MDEGSSPITELSNYITRQIDVGTSAEIVRLLRQCDAQLFAGWEKWPSIYDKQTGEAMAKVSRAVHDVLRNTNGAVVISGCGTSGRLAFLLSQHFNELAREQGLKPNYNYIIAGGDTALLTSQEAPEDSWEEGQEKLREMSEGCEKVVFIGVSCGLSAPFVAGQLDYCMDHPERFIPVLVGFNPVHLARDTPIKNSDKTFRDVATRLSGFEHGVIVNPVVGPEAIAGSSRMKGGSATKILLETILLKAHSEVAQVNHTSQGFPELLMCYEVTCRTVYNAAESIQQVAAVAGASLQRNGRVYYLGWGSLGKMGIIDASECVPTFSADFDDVRGFIVGGYGALGNREGEINVGQGPVLLDVKDFVQHCLPQLDSHDTIVVLFSESDDTRSILHSLQRSKATVVGVYVTANLNRGQIQVVDTSIFGILIKVCVPSVHEVVGVGSDESSQIMESHFTQCLKEMAVKWVLNAISTGAHILKGKVLRGYMIDLKLGNNKLFYRAVDMVSTFARVSREKALISILQAIYRAEKLNPNEMTKDVSNHVQQAVHVQVVVPLAILLATGRLGIKEALDALDSSTTANVLKRFSLL